MSALIRWSTLHHQSGLARLTRLSRPLPLPLHREVLLRMRRGLWLPLHLHLPLRLPLHLALHGARHVRLRLRLRMLLLLLLCGRPTTLLLILILRNLRMLHLRGRRWVPVRVRLPVRLRVLKLLSRCMSLRLLLRVLRPGTG